MREDRQRLDKWLWYARFAKTRSLAARLVTRRLCAGERRTRRERRESARGRRRRHGRGRPYDHRRPGAGAWPAPRPGPGGETALHGARPRRWRACQRSGHSIEPRLGRPEAKTRMTYVVNDNCIKCKYMDCVEVCPVDCFYEGENMLVIHPDECIDCGVCEPECPVDAIKPDTEPGLEQWLKLNADLAKSGRTSPRRRTPPADAKELRGRARQVREVLLAESRRGRLSPPVNLVLIRAEPSAPSEAERIATGYAREARLFSSFLPALVEKLLILGRPCARVRFAVACARRAPQPPARERLN